MEIIAGEWTGNLIHKKAIEISAKLNTIWDSGDVKQKERLQKLVFPKGIIYDRISGVVRTEKVNPIFAAISTISEFYKDKKTG